MYLCLLCSHWQYSVLGQLSLTAAESADLLSSCLLSLGEDAAALKIAKRAWLIRCGALGEFDEATQAARVVVVGIGGEEALSDPKI